MKLGSSAIQAFLALAARLVMEGCETINRGVYDEIDALGVVTHQGREWELEVRISPVDIYKSPLRPQGTA